MFLINLIHGIGKLFRRIGAIIRGNRMYREALKVGPPSGWLANGLT